MKKIFIVAVLLMLQLACFAQSGFYYQGVAKMTNGAPISSQTISIYISILSTSPDELFYKESHSIKTDDDGRFSLVVGEGSVLQGTFNEINWRSKEIWIQTEMDAGQGLEDMGKSRILPVPIATYALKAAYDYQIYTATSNFPNNIFGIMQGETRGDLKLGVNSYMYDHEAVQLTIENPVQGLTIDPVSFTVNAQEANTQTKALTVSANSGLAVGIYNIPVKGRSASGKVVSGTFPVNVMHASVNSYLVGRYNVADVIVGKTDTIFYEENIVAVGSDSVRFTSNVKHDDHYLLYNSVAEITNYGGNIRLEIQMPIPYNDPHVYAPFPQDIENHESFKINYTVYFDQKDTYESRLAFFRRIK